MQLGIASTSFKTGQVVNRVVTYKCTFDVHIYIYIKQEIWTCPTARLNMYLLFYRLANNPNSTLYVRSQQLFTLKTKATACPLANHPYSSLYVYIYIPQHSNTPGLVHLCASECPGTPLYVTIPGWYCGTRAHSPHYLWLNLQLATINYLCSRPVH